MTPEPLRTGMQPNGDECMRISTMNQRLMNAVKKMGFPRTGGACDQHGDTSFLPPNDIDQMQALLESVPMDLGDSCPRSAERVRNDAVAEGIDHMVYHYPDKSRLSEVRSYRSELGKKRIAPVFSMAAPLGSLHRRVGPDILSGFSLLNTSYNSTAATYEMPSSS